MADKKPEKKLTYFDVKLEVLLPTTLHYHILAETPEEALELAKRRAPNNVKYNLNHKRDIKVLIYDAGTTLLRLTKSLLK